MISSTGFLVVSGVVKFNLNTLIVPGLDLRQKKKKFSGFIVIVTEAHLGRLRHARRTGFTSPGWERVRAALSK
jgi:hypothetical protein